MIIETLLFLAPFMTPAHAQSSVCQVKSPQLKLALSCNRGAFARISKNLHFIESHEGQGNRPNYCYNTLLKIETSRDRSKVNIQAYYENSSGHLRGSRHQVPGQLPPDKVIEIPSLEGTCFGHEEAVDQNCQRLLFGRRKETLKLEASSLKSPQVKTLVSSQNKARGQAEKARKAGDNLDLKKLNKELVKEARSRLKKLADLIRDRQKQVHRKEDLRAKAYSYENCLSGLKKFVAKTGQGLVDFSFSELKDQREILSHLPSSQHQSPDSPSQSQQ